MNRSKRIQSIAKVAENEEKNAAKEMEKSIQLLQKHEAHLQELTKYREEYTESMNKSFSRGMDAVQLCQYRAFLTNLTQTIDRQVKVVSAATSELKKMRALWLGRYNRTKALEKAAKNYQLDELEQEKKKQQKIVDEISSRNCNHAQKKGFW